MNKWILDVHAAIYLRFEHKEHNILGAWWSLKLQATMVGVQLWILVASIVEQHAIRCCGSKDGVSPHPLLVRMRDKWLGVGQIPSRTRE